MSDIAPPEPVAARADRLSDRAPWYLWPNLLSLDAVAVALVWLWCFSVGLRVPLLFPIYPLLGLVVWTVYTLDHLLDALRMKDVSMSTPRHRFAKRYFVPLAILCGCAIALALWLVLYRMPSVLIRPGLLVAMLVVLYFVQRCSPKSSLHLLLPKEVFCGVIFAVGSTFVVHALPNNLAGGMLSPELWMFALLCALNCTAISCWELSEDAVNDRSTVVQHWPAVRGSYVKFAFVLAAVSAWLGVGGMPDVVAPILVSVAVSAASIGVIGLLEGALSKNLRRVLADLVLLSPLVIVPLMR